MAHISFSNETRASIPRAIFRKIGATALSTSYKLSVVFLNAANMKKLNLIYRDKPRTTDILSFPLTMNEGEIYICPSEARKEAVKFDRTYADFLKFLFIHGCVHLKGYDHGGTMERIEAKLRLKFNI